MMEEELEKPRQEIVKNPEPMVAEKEIGQVKIYYNDGKQYINGVNADLIGIPKTKVADEVWKMRHYFPISAQELSAAINAHDKKVQFILYNQNL